MLVLTRKMGEEIVIGGNIRVSVVNLKGGKVRIGIVAPGDVIVDRKEIHDLRLNVQPIGPPVLDVQPLFVEKPQLIALMKLGPKSIVRAPR